VCRLNQLSPAPIAGTFTPRVGVWMALVMQPMGLGHRMPDSSTNTAEWLPDGTVRIGLGAPEIGQGLATVSEQMLAEALEIPVELVTAGKIDTALVPNGGVTCASRMTFLVGNSLAIAAGNLKADLLSQAARLLGVEQASLTYRSGRVFTDHGLSIPAAEIAARLAEQNISLKASGTANFPDPHIEKLDSLPIGMPHTLFVFGAQAARVELDPELGTVRVTDLVAIHDPGRVINPQAAAGQVQGGAAMGLGYALLEDMPLKADGRWVSSFTEYLLPTSKDLPPRLEVILLESREESSVFGVKGLGEVVTAPTAPAIANAVSRAAGRQLNRLPISPEDLV
jgi:CO/xanthine dehydrogenase Mo-binding subunit